jgi:Iron-containing redox enzyme
MTLAADPLRPTPDRRGAARPPVHGPVPLPQARGPVSAALLDALRRRPWEARLGDALWWNGAIADAAADDDLQLALFCVYELHYRGLDGVAEDWEWQPDLLRVRHEWEQVLLAGLESEVGAPHSLQQRSREATVARLVETAKRERESSLAEYVMREARADQLRELLIHRSVAELRAGDLYAWALPRLSGSAKAALVGLEASTYGMGRLPLMRAELFRSLMTSWQLDPDYGHHVDRVPGVALLATNLLTLFGLHRRWRGALLGHLAATEVSGWLPSARLAHGHRRLGGSEAGSRFFDEQLGGGTNRERLATTGLVGGLLAQHPALSGDVVFGARCAVLLEDLLAAHVLPRWHRGSSSLRPAAGDPTD